MQFSKGVLMDKSALCILILFIPLVKADLLLSRKGFSFDPLHGLETLIEKKFTELKMELEQSRREGSDAMLQELETLGIKLEGKLRNSSAESQINVVQMFADALDPGRPNLDNDSFAVQGGQDRLSQGVTTLVNRLLKGEQRRDAMHFLILQYLEACDMNSAKSAEEGLRKEMETNQEKLRQSLQTCSNDLQSCGKGLIECIGESKSKMRRIMEQETELERVAQEKLAYDQEIESFKSSLSAKDIEIEGFKGKNEELEGILKSLESSLAAAEEKVLEGQANLTLSNEELGKEKLRTVELQKSLEDTVTAFEKYKQENQKNVDCSFSLGHVFQKGYICDIGIGKLVFQNDGNFVVYDGNRKHRWSSGTGNGIGFSAQFQYDGNLVVVSADGREKWHSGTGGGRGKRLIFQGDRNFVIFDEAGRSAWSSKTNG